MKTVCPSCGAIHSLEGLLTDGDARQAVAMITAMPGGVSQLVLSYLALFRGNSGRVLQWRRVKTLVAELDTLVKQPYIQRGQAVARSNDPRFWRQAMEMVVNKPPAKLPFKNHGYLHAIAWDLADTADRAEEKRRIEDDKRTPQRERGKSEPKKMTPELMREIRERNMGKVKARKNELAQPDSEE